MLQDILAPDGTRLGTFEYDSQGRKTGLIDHNGNRVLFGYDAPEHHYTVTDRRGNPTEYTYDSDGNVTAVTDADGHTETYSYDTDGNVLAHTNTLGYTTASTYDEDGNVLTETDPLGNTSTFTYDEDGNTLTATDPLGHTTSFTYDAVGNRLTKTDNGFTTTYTYNENHQLVKEDDIIYRYDNNGNLIEKDSAEEQILYEYDFENHLVRVDTTRYDTTIVVEYEYDTNGNRLRKTIDGLVTTTYLVDENRDYAQVLEERTQSGELLVRYIYGHDLISQTRDGISSYYHYDGLGSTRALSNENEAVTDTYTYDAFGLLLEQTGTTENAYLYRGEQFDEELGFYYLRARYMNPDIGRFVTMDPFTGLSQDPVTLHKYLYANANPITNNDPSGYFSISELNVGTMIRNILDKYNQAMLLPKYRVLVGSLAGAMENMIEARLRGETWEEIGLHGLVGGLVGGATSGVSGAVSHLLSQLPPHLLVKLCKLKYLVPVLGVWGLQGELEGVWEAVKQKNYDLAAWRATSVLITLQGLAHTWKSFACFPAETLVSTPTGPLPIKDIKIGDTVYAEEVTTGERGFKRVTHVFVRETTTLIQLEIAGETIETTPEHPFWMPEQGWTPAGQLQVGDEVAFFSGERGKITVRSQKHLTHPVKVYNLEVDDWHTYTVGQHKMLVHNTCDPSKFFSKEHPVVIIGETGADGVTNRAERYANKLKEQGFTNVTIYKPKADIANGERPTLNANREWLRRMTKKNVTIVDIGIAPGREDRGYYYAMESRMLRERWHYENIIEINAGF